MSGRAVQAVALIATLTHDQQTNMLVAPGIAQGQLENGQAAQVIAFITNLTPQQQTDVLAALGIARFPDKLGKS